MKKPNTVTIVGFLLLLLVLSRVNYYFYIPDIIDNFKHVTFIHGDKPLNASLITITPVLMVMADLLLLLCVVGIFQFKEWVPKIVSLSCSAYLTNLAISALTHGKLFLPSNISPFASISVLLPFAVFYMIILYIFNLPNIVECFVVERELQRAIESRAIFRAKSVGCVEILFGLVLGYIGVMLSWFVLGPSGIIPGLLLIGAGLLLMKRLESGRILNSIILPIYGIGALFALSDMFFEELGILLFSSVCFLLWQVTRSDLQLVVIPKKKDAWGAYTAQRSLFQDKELIWTIVLSLIILVISSLMSHQQINVFTMRQRKTISMYTGGIPAESTPTLAKVQSYKKKYYYRDSGELLAVVPMRYQKEHGVVKEYYKSGKLMTEAKYSNGKKNGLAKFYDENGKIAKEAVYRDDRIWSMLKEYRNGKLAKETPYKDGVVDGIKKIYYESGKIKWELPFKNGKPEGISYTYYKNGNVETKKHYRNGELNGKSYRYDEKGKLAMEENYRDGVYDGIVKIYTDRGIHQITYDNNEKIKDEWINNQ